ISYAPGVIQYTNPTSGLASSSGGNIGPTILSDSLVASTLMRWGNYDTVNAATQWNPSEVPSGLSSYANPVPSNHLLPASFIYTARPVWWPATKAWPPIGPDVSQGNLGMCSGGIYNLNMATANSQCSGGTLVAAVAGTSNSIPAMDCYLNVMGGPPDGTGSAMTFNGNTCYSAQLQPSPPTNLVAAPQ